jgi:hypothetical protein
MCACVVATTATVAVATKGTADPGLVGLAMVYILSLSGMFQVAHNITIKYFFIMIFFTSRIILPPTSIIPNSSLFESS